MKYQEIIAMDWVSSQDSSVIQTKFIKYGTYQIYSELLQNIRFNYKPSPSNHHTNTYHTIHTAPQAYHLKSSKLTNNYRSSKINIPYTPSEFPIPHNNQKYTTVRVNSLSSNFSDKKSLTIFTSKKKTSSP